MQNADGVCPVPMQQRPPVGDPPYSRTYYYYC